MSAFDYDTGNSTLHFIALAMQYIRINYNCQSASPV